MNDIIVLEEHGKCTCVDLLNSIGVHLRLLMCENYYNKINKTKSQCDNSMNAQMQHGMFYPLLNKHSGEACCIENLAEYHKLLYLELPYPANV